MSKDCDSHLGKFVYCIQHMRVHSTGWCTVEEDNKIPLPKETLSEARVYWKELRGNIKTWGIDGE